MQHPALIYVDGQIFIRLHDGDDYCKEYQRVIEKIGGEVVLAIHDPSNDMYCKYKVSFTEPKVIK
jgi:hypothetical protein